MVGRSSAPAGDDAHGRAKLRLSRGGRANLGSDGASPYLEPRTYRGASTAFQPDSIPPTYPTDWCLDAYTACLEGFRCHHKIDCSSTHSCSSRLAFHDDFLSIFRLMTAIGSCFRDLAAIRTVAAPPNRIIARAVIQRRPNTAVAVRQKKSNNP